jgi:hypothetical protein
MKNDGEEGTTSEDEGVPTQEMLAQQAQGPELEPFSVQSTQNITLENIVMGIFS